MTADAKQFLFDAVYAAFKTHAPETPSDRRMAAATDVALKFDAYLRGEDTRNHRRAEDGR